MAFDALILDKDGVLFDSERIYAQSLIETARAWGRDDGEALICAFTGMDNRSITRRLCALLGGEGQAEKFVKEWLARKDDIYAKDGLPFIDGADVLIRKAYDAGYPLALVTSDSLDHVLEDFSVTDYSLMQCFSVIITVDDVANPKPHPEPYQRAMALLGVNADKVLVVEDSDVGATAALDAGANVLLLAHGREVAPAIAGRVRGIIASHEESWAALNGRTIAKKS